MLGPVSRLGLCYTLQVATVIEEDPEARLTTSQVAYCGNFMQQDRHKHTVVGTRD